jgi:hypothetical protein
MHGVGWEKLQLYGLEVVYLSCHVTYDCVVSTVAFSFCSHRLHNGICYVFLWTIETRSSSQYKAMIGPETACHLPSFRH